MVFGIKFAGMLAHPTQPTDYKNRNAQIVLEAMFSFARAKSGLTNL
jgi:hypothetical protein